MNSCGRYGKSQLHADRCSSSIKTKRLHLNIYAFTMMNKHTSRYPYTHTHIYLVFTKHVHTINIISLLWISNANVIITVFLSSSSNNTLTPLTNLIGISMNYNILMSSVGQWKSSSSIIKDISTINTLLSTLRKGPLPCFITSPNELPSQQRFYSVEHHGRQIGERNYG